MPRPEELPEPIRPLATRNAMRLTFERFRADVQILIKALQQELKEAAEDQLIASIRAMARASTHAMVTITGTTGAIGVLQITAASPAANDLFGIDLEDGQGRRLVGCTMTQFISALEKLMSPAQWRAFERDQRRMRLQLSPGRNQEEKVALVPIVFEKHENPDFNHRAFLPIIMQDYRSDSENDGDYHLQVFYLNVTTATEKEISQDGEEYYVCRFDPVSNARLEPLKLPDRR